MGRKGRPPLLWSGTPVHLAPRVRGVLGAPESWKSCCGMETKVPPDGRFPGGSSGSQYGYYGHRQHHVMWEALMPSLLWASERLSRAANGDLRVGTDLVKEGEGLGLGCCSRNLC